MREKSKYFGLFWAILLLIVVLDSKLAMDSASEAISMCIRSVIPSLFPMMFLGGLLTGHLGGRYGLFLVGILGGYPVGASCIAQAYRQGAISRTSAERMLGYCNNPGPSFLFGILGPLLPSLWICWVLWAVIILSSGLTALTIPGKTEPVSFRPRAISPSDSLRSSLRALATICGWVILFKVLIGFLGKWLFPILPGISPLVLTGLLELTNGCLSLGEVAEPGNRFLLAVLFLTGGGICVAMQTASVTGELGLGMYLPGKVIQTAWAMILASVAHPILFPEEKGLVQISFICAVILLIFRLIVVKNKNNSSNLSPAVV